MEIEFPIFFRVFVKEFQSLKAQTHEWSEERRRYWRNFGENSKELNLNACCTVSISQSKIKMKFDCLTTAVVQAVKLLRGSSLYTYFFVWC